MTAQSHQKFMFDRDFGLEEDEAAAKLAKKVQDDLEAELSAFNGTGEAKPEEPVEEAPPVFSEEDVKKARDEGFQAGREEAVRELTGSREDRVAAALASIDEKIAGLMEAHDRDKDTHSRDAVGVAAVIVRKLFPSLNMDHALAQIEQMITEAMQRTSSSPMLVVRVPEDLVAEVEELAYTLAVARGREGLVSVMADEDLSGGDVHLEWDGGGMVRDTQLMWQAIDDIIERNLGSDPAEDADESDLADGVTEDVENAAPLGDNEAFAPESE
ncbi:MAG: hypothetical protein HQL35_14390 [Alphaproteobacteria bacterium]|nr:hypothetical protein [Alphaproteobacteria bacterium]